MLIRYFCLIIGVLKFCSIKKSKYITVILMDYCHNILYFSINLTQNIFIALQVSGVTKTHGS